MKNLNFDKIEPNTIIDEVSNTEYYIGTSENGIDLSKPTWKIKRILKVGNIWKFGYPNGNQTYEYVWNSRYEYAYK